METPDYPNDSDGDALRRLVRGGSDMSRPMEIDYHVDVGSQEAGDRIAEAAGRLGYAAKVVRNEVDTRFTVWCSRRMVPSHDDVVAAQRELNLLAAPFGGKTDGWGTFGNVPGNQPE